MIITMDGNGGGDNKGNDCEHHGYADADNNDNGHSDGGEYNVSDDNHHMMMVMYDDNDKATDGVDGRGHDNEI